VWQDITTLCERCYRELERFLMRRVRSPDTDTLPGPGDDVIRRRGDGARGMPRGRGDGALGRPNRRNHFVPTIGGRVMLQSLWAGRSVVDSVYAEVQPGEAGGGTCHRLRHASIQAFAVEKDVASLDQ
jgi:hypothetical protein